MLLIFFLSLPGERGQIVYHSKGTQGPKGAPGPSGPPGPFGPRGETGGYYKSIVMPPPRKGDQRHYLTIRVFTREQSAQFEWSFELRIISNDGILPRVYAKYAIWIAQFKWWSGGVFQWRISQITQRIAVWMPWPLNCDLGGGAISMSEEHRYEPRFFSPLWSAKPQTSKKSSLSSVYTRRSNLLLCENTQCFTVFKQSMTLMPYKN